MSEIDCEYRAKRPNEFPICINSECTRFNNVCPYMTSTTECVGDMIVQHCQFFKPLHVNVLEGHSPEPDPQEEDQTIKADADKPKLTLVPQQIIFDVARVREYGLKKYGTSESWKSVDIQRYRDATYRHFLAYLKDPHGVDDESGLSHLSHLACNIAFLCELEHDNQIIKDNLEKLVDYAKEQMNDISRKDEK